MPEVKWVQIECGFCGATVTVLDGRKTFLMPLHEQRVRHQICLGSGCITHREINSASAQAVAGTAN